MRIITLGPKGTFSEEAALIYQKRICGQIDRESIDFSSLPDCFGKVKASLADRAVLPAENMVDGIIGLTFDLLLDYHNFIKVCDEVHVIIRHVLAGKMSLPTDIKEILSHPSALNQCAYNLSAGFSGIPQTPVLSTAEAAYRAAKEQGIAAVCSPRTARQYGLKIIQDNLGDYKENQTRFLVCSKTDSPPTGNDRTLLAVRFGINYPGQLNEITKYFLANQIDLTFVQSRPYKLKPEEYILLFEMIGHQSEVRFKETFCKIEEYLQKTGGWKRVLGSYPRREKEELFVEEY